MFHETDYEASASGHLTQMGEAQRSLAFTSSDFSLTAQLASGLN